MKSSTILFSIIALCLSGMAAAQASPQSDKGVSVSKIERKNKAPVSKEILKVKLPRPVESKLPNGLTVLILEDHRMPQVSVSLMIDNSGGLNEPASQRGLAVMTAQMLEEGTTTRTSKQIAEDFDRLGASMFGQASFGLGSTLIGGSGLSENFDDWFASYIDVLMNANFPAGELAKLKQRQLAQLRQQRSNPNFLGNERFNKVIYGSHPASVTAPTAEGIQALTSEALAKWKQERYVPQNAILSIAGDVRAAELTPKLAKWLGGWKKTDLQETPLPNPKPASVGKIYIVDRPGSVQTVLTMGNIAIDRRDPDYPAMVVLNQIFGAGPSSRLFINIREEKGYTYGVYSRMNPAKYSTAWSAGGGLRTEVTEPAMVEFVKEIKRIREERVPDAELDEARRAVVASFALSLENPQQLISYSSTIKFYGFPADYWDTYPAKIAAVTSDDLMRVAKKYYDPATMQVVAVGDSAKIKAGLEKFGPVEVYDADGKPVVAKAPAGGSGQ